MPMPMPMPWSKRASMSSAGRSSGESLRCAPATTQPIADPGRLDQQAAFAALFPAVDRGPVRGLAATGGLDDAAIDGDITQVESDQTVVGLQRDVLEPIEDPGLDPLITSLADRGRRARAVGGPRVPDHVDQDLDQLVEHNPIGDPGPMTAEGMGIDAIGQQLAELVPQRFDDRRWQRRHEHLGEGRRRQTPLLLPSLVPVLRHRHAPIRAISKESDMRVSKAADTDVEAVGSMREGKLDQKHLLFGEDGSPNNYDLNTGHNGGGGGRGPRPRPNFDPIRYVIAGPPPYTQTQGVEGGWGGYFPPSAPHGPPARAQGL